jgi:hypothetical protein
MQRFPEEHHKQIQLVAIRSTPFEACASLFLERHPRHGILPGSNKLSGTAMVKLVIEIIGWVGASLMLLGYLLLTTGKVSSHSSRYQWLNIFAGAGFIVNSGWNGAYPSACINVLWVIIAVYGLLRHGRQPPAASSARATN